MILKKKLVRRINHKRYKLKYMKCLLILCQYNSYDDFPFDCTECTHKLRDFPLPMTSYFSGSKYVKSGRTTLSDRLIPVKSYSVLSKIGHTDKLHELPCSSKQKLIRR